MYKPLLIFKYLRKRRIAWVSLIAVTLCTAMVLVVISVMGGWLRMFKQSFHGLTGDIIVRGESLAGFPYYEEMQTELEKLPQVKAVVPTIETFGLININNKVRRGVQVLGYPIDRIGSVNRFPQSLYLQYQRYVNESQDPKKSPEERAAAAKLAEAGAAHPSFNKPLSDATYRELLPKAQNDPAKMPGMILGCGVLGIHKDETGEWVGRGEGLYENWVSLVCLGVSGDPGNPDIQSGKSEKTYWIADDSRTQIWQNDTQTVYVDFNELQHDLKMDAYQVTDTDTGKPFTLPARTRTLEVAVKPGVDLNAAKKEVQRVVDEVQLTHGFSPQFPIVVETWEESQAVFLGAVEHEKALVTVLFSLISVVAIFLIFCIFYMIVVEKTRDIGIIKSVGATSGGVAAIFLGYGLVIGILGGLLGLAAGYGIVHNINFLHEQMAHYLGIVIWNPEVYAFDTIPNTMDPKEVSVIVAVAVVSAVLGALVPAVRAARLNPVEALRFE